jgi:hypothetical protein
VPSLVEVAVNVTPVPAQSGFVPEVRAIEIVGAPVGFTTIVIAALVAESGLLQMELIKQVIISAFANVVEE